MTAGVVCVGAGWATGERHLPALLRDPRARVLGVVDKHPERAERLARRFDLPSWGTSLDEPWVEAASCLTVATPPLDHAATIRLAIERDLHCLSEKPFAFPAGEAARLVEAARERRLVLAVVHNFQFSRSGRRLFDLVEHGRLGQIEAVYGFQLSNPRRRLPHWHTALPGGLFLDEAPHLLYLTRRLLGRLEPRAVDARLHGTEITALLATFEHESIWASLSMSFESSISEWQFVVVGRRAVAALDLFRDVLLVLPNDGGHRAREVLGTSARLVAGHASGFAASGARLVGRRLLFGNDHVVSRFLDAVEGRTDGLRWMDGADGVAVVTCLEDILGRVGLALGAPAPA